MRKPYSVGIGTPGGEAMLRNGLLKAARVQVAESYNNFVVIEVETSRGNLATGWIRLPADSMKELALKVVRWLSAGDTVELKYVEAAGMKCPFCGGPNPSDEGYPESSGRQLFQKVTCNDCGLSWTDIYQLVGVDLA